jgi:hypothetical protein
MPRRADKGVSDAERKKLWPPFFGYQRSEDMIEVWQKGMALPSGMMYSLFVRT